MTEYTWSFVSPRAGGKRVRGKGDGFKTKAKAEADLRKIKAMERKRFGRVMPITQSIRVVKK